MAEGNKTYNGLAIPLFGEYEQKQTTIGTDMVTLTGKASMTGDFLVCQNSTGAESFVVGVTGSFAATQQQLTVSATTMIAGLNVVVSSTGALEALGTVQTAVCGVTVSPDSDAIMNTAFAYAGGSTATGNSAITMLACMGANSLPSYFLSIGASAGDALYVGVAPADDAGFIDASCLITTWDDSDWIGFKSLLGSKTIYLLAYAATGIT